MEEQPFYKTDSDFAEELCLGKKELRNAKAKLKKLGIIKTFCKDWPAKTYYLLDESILLAKISSLPKRAKLNCPKRPNLIVRKSQTILAEKDKLYNRDNTQTTTEIKNFSQKGLSSRRPDQEQERAYRLLLRYGVDRKVATAIVFEQLTPPESIEEAVKNGLVKEKYEKGFILKPGYIVEALNTARRESKVIGPTKKSKALKRVLSEKQKNRGSPPISQTEFEKRKKKQLAAIAAN